MRHKTRWVLLLTLVLTALLYIVPLGRYVIYPCMLLSTLAHEMGHGVAAILVGGDFERLQMWPDGSGVATWSGRLGPVERSFVAAGGLVGPAVVAALAFIVGRTPRGARACLAAFALILVVSEVFVVRGGFALGFVAGVALLCLLVARSRSQDLPQWVLIFLAVQLTLSVFSRGDYLFTAVAETNAGLMPSDVEHMAAALPFPFWFWGGVCAAFSLLVLTLGLRVFWRTPARAPSSAPGSPPRQDTSTLGRSV